jgi:Flp pilus assembly protein TadG
MVSRVARSLERLGRCRRGASAVEFAIVFPLFVAVLFGILIYGSYIGIIHGVQQIAAEAARASVGGLSDSERQTLARDNIAASLASYPLIAATRLTLESASTDAGTRVFSVTVRYDASDMFIFQLPTIVSGPDKIIVRSAAIQRGGY